VGNRLAGLAEKLGLNEAESYDNELVSQDTYAEDRAADEEVGVTYKIKSVAPRSYADAREIGEAYRNGTPVMLNLAALSKEEAKRMIDFVTGLSFGLYGAVEKIDERVFMVTPSDIQIDTGGSAATGVINYAN
jgi:cell division inhibitor SepF